MKEGSWRNEDERRKEEKMKLPLSTRLQIVHQSRRRLDSVTLLSVAMFGQA
jgi:hypothetical protein